MLEAQLASASQKQRKIFGRVATAFAVVHARAVKHHRIVQQVCFTLGCGLQLIQESGELADMESINCSELRQLLGIATVMRKLMVILTLSAKATGFARPLESNDSRRVGLQRETTKFQHHIEPRGPIVTIWNCVQAQTIAGHL